MTTHTTEAEERTTTVLCPRCGNDGFEEIWQGWSETPGKLRLSGAGDLEFEAERDPSYDGNDPLIYRCLTCCAEFDADDLEVQSGEEDEDAGADGPPMGDKECASCGYPSNEKDSDRCWACGERL
jgi:ribosomal protein L37E